MSVAFVFPGQGSQAVGMGHDLYEASPTARAVFDQADATLGFALTQLCFTGPETTLTATRVCPARAADGLHCAASGPCEDASQRQTQQSTAYGVALAFVAGHSLGEYAALVAADALDFPTALRLVQRRGR